MCMAQPTTIEERQARKDLQRVFRLLTERFERQTTNGKRNMIDVLMVDVRSFDPPKL